MKRMIATFEESGPLGTIVVEVQIANPTAKPKRVKITANALDQERRLPREARRPGSEELVTASPKELVEAARALVHEQAQKAFQDDSLRSEAVDAFDFAFALAQRIHTEHTEQSKRRERGGLLSVKVWLQGEVWAALIAN